MDRMDFNNWITGKPDWPEVKFQYNTGQAYQHKQDLEAVFWNSYIYFQPKIEKYYAEFDKLPVSFLNELIFDFRQHFPKSGRVEGINYYDDLIEQRIQKYSTPSEDNSKIPGFDFSKQKPRPSEVIIKVFNLLSCEEIIKGEQSDFIAMFSKNGVVEAPIEWILKVQNGNRGNQGALLTFLKIMFGKLTSENIRRASRLFIDDKGIFLTQAGKPKNRVLKEPSVEKSLKEILNITGPNGTV